METVHSGPENVEFGAKVNNIQSLLIRKQDLPVIKKIDEKIDGWKLNWQDNSSFDENRLEVRVEIDTNLELRYNPKAKVMKYKTIPMKI